MLEPRGHADMYGCWLTEPVTDDGDVGVLFLHNEGWSTMCGHGIIGLVKVGLEYGLFSTRETDVVRVDTPAGRVLAKALRGADGRVESVSFRNVPSFVLEADCNVTLPGGERTIRCDLAFGGAFYAYVDANDLDLSLTPTNQSQLVDVGKRIKAAVQSQCAIRHPESPDQGSDLDFLYGVIFTGPAKDPNHDLRNVCVFADGEVDRSPTGTGVSGRMAIEVARGRATVGADSPTLQIESILGTTFDVRAVDATNVGTGSQMRSAVVPEVSGRAWVTGVNELLIDPTDTVGNGFLVR